MQIIRYTMMLLGLSLADVAVWQPYYNFAEGYKALYEQQSRINQLYLQFWNVDTAGKIFMAAPESELYKFRNFARQSGISVKLCVFNVNPKLSSLWDWKSAQKGFKDQKLSFINSLLRELDQYQLDGIDLDIEGGEASDEVGKKAYMDFVKDLRDSLNTRKKSLSVDTYAYIWHAPSQSYWGNLAPLVDEIHVMGYEQTAACTDATSWTCYQGQWATAQRAGLRKNQLYLGFPAEQNLASWKDFSLAQNLTEAQRLGLPIAIWDLPGMGKSEWMRPEIYEILKIFSKRP